MSLPIWLHCHKCYTKHQGNMKFILTECGHIHCQKCALKIEHPDCVCTVCARKTKVITLSKDAAPSVLAYFKPASNQMQELTNIIQFQMSNQLGLLQKREEKYNLLKSEYFKSVKTLNDYKKEMLKLKNENLRLKAEYKNITGGRHANFSTSTPMGGNNNYSPNLYNSSMASMGSSISPGLNRGNRPGFAVRMHHPHMINSFNKHPQPSPHVVPVHSKHNSNNLPLSISSLHQLSMGSSRSSSGHRRL